MHNIAAAAGNITGAPWKDLETVYIYLVQDLAIRLSLQRSMVKDAVRAGGRIQTEVIDAGHCAFLSRPDEVVEIVLRVTGRC
jgi:pimeloyl-ACP methyl ester carboxylesterase